MSQHEDPRPLGGYAVLISVYAFLVTALVVALRSRRANVKPLSLRDLFVTALAAQHLSRLVTKDSVLSPLRKPFTRFVSAAGEGEVNEEVVGRGVRHAVGELLSCPFCFAQWVATVLVAGTIATPELASAGISVLAVAQVSDFLQLGYGALRRAA
jgi:hypothetical protein